MLSRFIDREVLALLRRDRYTRTTGFWGSVVQWSEKVVQMAIPSAHTHSLERDRVHQDLIVTHSFANDVLCFPDHTWPTSDGSYCATKPPSTGIGTPVIKEASSEQSHATALATSSGVPNRFTGSCASN